MSSTPPAGATRAQRLGRLPFTRQHARLLLGSGTATSGVGCALRDHAEIYPAALRGTGACAAAGFGRIASIVAPLTVPVVLERGGASGEVIVFSRFTVAFVGAGAAAWLLPELRGQVLR
ncbi:hypothetical protein [Janibacter hoylei]|uniref:hypothetical protein n=1 Tax=Janibacter hoylei TaxID=364298 RepID=UPI0027B93B80|nr:hypothetical protein [Janibacter hoylei]